MGRRRIAGWEEEDAYTGWRHFILRLQNAGVKKQAKRRTHHRERQAARREIRKAQE